MRVIGGTAVLVLSLSLIGGSSLGIVASKLTAFAPPARWLGGSCSGRAKRCAAVRSIRLSRRPHAENSAHPCEAPAGLASAAGFSGWLFRIVQRECRRGAGWRSPSHLGAWYDTVNPADIQRMARLVPDANAAICPAGNHGHVG
jgi:hypothetical protein